MSAEYNKSDIFSLCIGIQPHKTLRKNNNHWAVFLFNIQDYICANLTNTQRLV